MPAAYHYCFTLFQTGDEPQALEDCDWQSKLTTAGGIVRYCTFQLEQCPETGNLHYQGYLELTVKRGITSIKAYLPWLSTAHFEQRKGTRDEARDYCHKTDTRADGTFTGYDCGPWEFGLWVGGSGARTDILSVVELIKGGSKPDQVAEEVPALYLRLHRGIQALHSATQLKPLTRSVTVDVYWGDPGSGKTYKAFQDAGDDRYVKEPSNRWFCGYTGQKTLILDDFEPATNPSGITYRQLLRLLDRYECQVEVKGGNVWAQWDRVIITSNTAPHTWYGGESWTAGTGLDGRPIPGALARRIRSVKHFTAAGLERHLAALAAPAMPAEEDAWGAEDQEQQAPPPLEFM